MAAVPHEFMAAVPHEYIKQSFFYTSLVSHFISFTFHKNTSICVRSLFSRLVTKNNDWNLLSFSLFFFLNFHKNASICAIIYIKRLEICLRPLPNHHQICTRAGSRLKTCICSFVVCGENDLLHYLLVLKCLL